MLNQFYIFAPYNIRVTAAAYDSTGNEVSPGSLLAYAYMWVVEIPVNRPEEIKSQNLTLDASGLTTVYDGVTPTIVIDWALSRNHSIPVGGTF